MPGFELFGDEERKEVQDVLESGVLMRYGFDGARNGHWKAAELEAALAGRLGSRHAHVCSSGTAAVATALAACGVGAGDEVIVPPFTFVADIEAVLFAGAVPVFAEIDESLGLDPASVDAAITERTKAVLVVHMCGSMARIDALADVCRTRGITLIEDAAQAIGGTFEGRCLGTIGRAGCYSFDYVKTVTCGEGGGIVTDDDDVYETIQAFTDHGHDHRGADRGKDLHPHMGFNYRISELHAAVGIAQLRKLDTLLATNRRHKTHLREALDGIDRIGFRHTPDPDGDSATFLDLLLPDETEARAVAAELAGAGVDGCFYWFDNNWHYHTHWSHLKDMVGPAPLAQKRFDYGNAWASRDLPQSDAIMGRTISMLIKAGWTDADVAERAKRMQAVMNAGVCS